MAETQGPRKPSGTKGAKSGKSGKKKIKTVTGKVLDRVDVAKDVTPKGTLPFEIDPKRVEESLDKLGEQIVYWAKKGRYTKVRFKFRGKQVMPDLPVAAVVAAQGLTFWWAGMLRALVFSMAGNTLFDVQFVNDSEKKIAQGKEQLLAGELERAIALFKEARSMDVGNANVHLNLGVAFKLKGELLSARGSLEKAQALDPQGPIGKEAERVLGGIPKPPAPTPASAAE